MVQKGVDGFFSALEGKAKIFGTIGGVGLGLAIGGLVCIAAPAGIALGAGALLGAAGGFGTGWAASDTLQKAQGVVNPLARTVDSLIGKVAGHFGLHL